MLYDFIVKNYEDGEPIFISELPCNSKDYLRQEMKRLVDEGKLQRLYNGVYYLNYITAFGAEGKISVDKYIEKRFLMPKGMVGGYITGVKFASMYGFTSQSVDYIEICTNEATTKQRKIVIDGIEIVVHRPVTKITEENWSILQFLDFMTSIDKYNELSDEMKQRKLTEMVSTLDIDFDIVRKYILLFPDRVFRNFYRWGLMIKLT